MTNQSAGENMGGWNFLDLPEDCIAKIFSSTSPGDTCRLSAVSSKLSDLLQSDSVWLSFLPSDYQSIISQSSDSSTLNRFPSKKQLYLSLSDNQILIENGRKSFALEKSTGKKKYMISARAVHIEWGDNPIYWRWKPDPDSIFGEVAELMGVIWFEITGKINPKTLSPSTKYEFYLVFKSTGAHNFEYHPAEATVGIAGMEGKKLSVYLKGERGGGKRRYKSAARSGFFRQRKRCEVEGVEGEEMEYPRERGDGWSEVKLGEFFNGASEEGELGFSIMEVEGGFWKRGILVQGIEVRPVD